MIHLIAITVFFLYAGSALSGLVGVFRSDVKFWTTLSRSFLISAAIGQVCYMCFFLYQGMDVKLVWSDIFLWIALVIGAGYLLLFKKYTSATLTALVASVCTLIFTSSGYLVHDANTSTGSVNWLVFFFHVIPAILSQLCIIVIWIASGLYLIQDRRLRSRILSSVAFDGPSLTFIERSQSVFTNLGFALMTLAVLSGAGYSVSYGIRFLAFDLTAISSLVGWIVLAILIQLRVSHYSAKKISQFALYLLGALLILVLISSVLLENMVHNL